MMKKTKNTPRGRLQSAAAFSANTLVYGLNGIYSAIPLYLSAVGFTEVQRGYLLAINPLVMCFSPVIWGRILDRCRSKNVIFSVLIALAAVSYVGIALRSSFYWIAAMLLLYSFFQAPFNAVIDTLTVYFTDRAGRNYGAFRVMGTVGYGILAVLVTLYTNATAAFVLYAVVAVLAAVSVCLMLRTPGGGTAARKSGGLGGFSRAVTPAFWLLVAVMALTQFVWGFYANFYPAYLSETLGCSGSVWGWLGLVTAYAEIPFFLLYDRLFRRFSAGGILAVSLGLLAVRFAGLLLLTDLRAIFVLGFLTGAFITVVNYCATLYIMRSVPPEHLSLTQNLSYAVGWGVPRILAGCVGGYMMQYLGFRLSMGVCAGLLAVSLAALLPLRGVVRQAAAVIRLPEKDR